MNLLWLLLTHMITIHACNSRPVLDITCLHTACIADMLSVREDCSGLVSANAGIHCSALMAFAIAWPIL